MKKMFITFALATATIISAKAQDENTTATTTAPTGSTATSKSIFHVNLGLDGVVPFGGWSDMYSFGFGGSAKGAVQLCDQAAITLTAGYTRFFAKGTTGTNIADQSGKGIGYIPVRAGFQYSMGPVYIEPQGGMGHFTGLNSSDGNTGFSYAGNVGVKFNVFDISARYEGITNHGTNNMVGLRVAVGF